MKIPTEALPGLREIFLELYGKMEAQKWKQSIGATGEYKPRCLYRGAEGWCCMVGHLIPLEISPPEISVVELFNEEGPAADALKARNPGLEYDDWESLLVELQEIHDQGRCYNPGMKLLFLECAAKRLGQPLFAPCQAP